MRQEAVCEVCGDWARESMSSDPHHPTCPVGKAVAAMKKRCIEYIRRQNALVNDLLGGNRHDAFVADITAGIGNLD